MRFLFYYQNCQHWFWSKSKNVKAVGSASHLPSIGKKNLIKGTSYHVEPVDENISFIEEQTFNPIHAFTDLR